MLNVDDIKDAVGELDRAATRGLAGGMIPIRPLGHRYDHPLYEPLWAAAQDLNTEDDRLPGGKTHAFRKAMVDEAPYAGIGGACYPRQPKHWMGAAAIRRDH